MLAIRLLSIFIISIPFVGESSNLTHDKQVLQIINRHIEASGGKPALLAIQTISRIGTIEFFSDLGSEKFSYRTDIVYPIKLREKISGSKILIDRGTDGNSFWEWKENAYVSLKDSALRNQMKQTAEKANRDILWLEKDYDKLIIEPLSPDWAFNSTCLRGFKSNVETFICFNKTTGLLSAKGTSLEHRLFSQWTQVNDVWIPFHQIHFKENKKAYEIHLETVWINRKIPSSRFKIPTSNSAPKF